MITRYIYDFSRLNNNKKKKQVQREVVEFHYCQQELSS